MQLLNSPIVPTRNPLLQLDLIHYVLDYIACDFWDPDNEADRKKACQTLVALAQTCRVLSEPSLDRLWRKLGSLQPLIRSFTSMWKEERKNIPLSSAEWAVVRRYSNRIRELEIDSLDQESYWFLEATSVEPCPLFPNLGVLGWLPAAHIPALHAIDLIWRLLNPSLVSINLYLNVDDAMVQSFLSNLPYCCPNLKSIDIIGWEYYIASHWNAPQTTIGSISQVVFILLHLECLRVNVPVIDVAFSHIATSPKIKELDLVLHPNKSNLHRFRLPPGTIPFRNVVNLSLRLWDLGFLTMLLRTEGQIFRSLNVDLHSRPTIHTFSAFLDALVTPQRMYSLQCLTLTASTAKSDVPQIGCTPTRLSYEALRPLARLSQLRRLSITLDHCLVINDDDLTSLASQWPMLWDLKLAGCCGPHAHFSQAGKHITLNGLLHLVACCPRIRSLSLPVDATVVPTNTPGQIAPNSTLTRVVFTESPIRSPYLVAEFFHQHFSSFCTVLTTFHQPSMYSYSERQNYIKAWHKMNQAFVDLALGFKDLSDPHTDDEILIFNGYH